MTAAAIISAGLSAGSEAAKWWQAKKNREEQRIQNEKDRQFQREMYDRQRTDALADFAQTNAYNSPEQQMTRLRQAGLNPNLVYGKGADNTAQAIRSSSANTPNQDAPQFDTSAIGDWSSPMATYQQAKAIQATTDLTQQNIQVQQQDALLKQSQVAKTVQDTAKSSFELAQAKELKDSVIQHAKLTNELTKQDVLKRKADTTYTLDENQRAALQNSQNLKKTAQEILESQQRVLESKYRTSFETLEKGKITAEIEQIKSNIKLLDNEQAVKQAEAELTKQGVFKSDPWYIRRLMEILEANRTNSKAETFQKLHNFQNSLK